MARSKGKETARPGKPVDAAEGGIGASLQLLPGDLSRGHHALVALDDVDFLAALDEHEPKRRGHPIVNSGPTGAVGVHRVGSAEGDRGDCSVEAFPLVSGQCTIAVEPDLAGGGDLAGLRPGGGGAGLSFDGKTVGTT